jgi:hypothetical protein
MLRLVGREGRPWRDGLEAYEHDANLWTPLYILTTQYANVSLM